MSLTTIMPVPGTYSFAAPSTPPHATQPSFLYHPPSAGESITLLMILTLIGLTVCLALVAIMHSCKRPRHARSIVLSRIESTTTLPYYPDVAVPPPAYFPQRENQDDPQQSLRKERLP